MSTSRNEEPEELINRCALCGTADLESIARFPGLPLSGRFVPEQPAVIPPGIDQELLWCQGCGHGQLRNQIAPATLYDVEYAFRTSESARARVGTSFFLDVLDEFAASDGYSCAIDVGCNDFFFLQELGDRARTRVGIDPIWAGREDEFESSIEVIGTTVEDADLASRLDDPPDLIALRHTIEHIDDPLGMVQVLADVAADDAIFLFETPGFDALIRRNRFDQIFHQHVQYFTIGSLRRMMESVGLEYLGHRENYHDFGAFAAVFRKSAKRTTALFTDPSIWTGDEIRQHHGIFKQQMGMTSEVLDSLSDGVIYGYGAANLLPVMAYHLETDLGFMDAVLDDDPAKDGMAYWNLSVEIRHAAKADDLSQSTVLITAVDNVAPIMARLLQNRPRHIVYPLTVI